MAVTLDENGASRGPDAGIDDNYVDGTFTEPAVGFGDDERGFVDVERRDFVGDIDDGDARREAQDDALHDTDEMIVSSEISS